MYKLIIIILFIITGLQLKAQVIMNTDSSKYKLVTYFNSKKGMTGLIFVNNFRNDTIMSLYMGQIKPIDFILDGNNLFTLTQIGIGSNSFVTCDFDKYFFENGKWKSYRPAIKHNIYVYRLFSDMPPKEVWEKNIHYDIVRFQDLNTIVLKYKLDNKEITKKMYINENFRTEIVNDK